jgi:predicted metal-dependent hydrolase
MNDEEKNMKRLEKQVEAARASLIKTMKKFLEREKEYLTSKSHLFEIMVNYNGRIEKHCTEYFFEEIANKYVDELNKFVSPRLSGPQPIYWVEPISKRLAAIEQELTEYE